MKAKGIPKQRRSFEQEIGSRKVQIMGSIVMKKK